MREKLSEMNTAAQENIAGNRVVKAFAREDYETAVPYMRGCVDTYDGGDNKELAMLNLRLASLYVLQEDYTAGVEALDRAIELDGTLAAAWFLRAELQLTLGDAAAAVEDLGEQRRGDPRFAGLAV